MANEGNKVTKHWLSELPFTRINYFLFLAGLFVIVLGYILMGTGELNSTQALTVSPIILLVGYLVIIPISILYRDKH
jgi:membrane protease YdiL (CAAX protease family)